MRKSITIYIVTFLFLALPIACRKGTIPVVKTETVRDFGEGTGTTTWTKNQKYLLEGFIFVNEGQTLTIEPGTVIRGKTGQGENASALIVARGGKIIARGTREEPIVFTVEGDDLAGSVPVKAKGLWGGLILLGNARLNIENNETHIEGIPFSEPRGLYGGSLDDDNSGILEYVSVRHGGTNIGSGNEINGLTLGGVGSKTEINHIEIISNLDDGVECFGGTVNLRYIAVSYCGDDAFDFDLGYHGNAQFLLAIQSRETGDKIIEITGGISPGYGLPYTLPAIANLTGIGRGFNSGSKTGTISANGAGLILNSIFVNQDEGIYIEFTDFLQDCFKHLQNGTLQIAGNSFWNVADNDSANLMQIMAEQGTDISGPVEYLENYIWEHKNEITDYGTGRTGDRFKIRPDTDIFNGMASLPSSWFQEANYKGAFQNDNWISGWTLLDKEGKVQF